ncbi:rhodanese-like domain-containing protein [Oscillatoria sp. CS-180]|uniref:rhodanese-like domain-containing protein n=1 Tax=Oscillatoria sp. CS-180 TaxID=3021720 RepID=UPI00232AC209|nr:rhodanese-like domain-containing protein [Oscillatoria sp. CS-180]MDB9524737.1 rhodanese-like domain-containing protein [Oscillatoria sp. CS-180]
MTNFITAVEAASEIATEVSPAPVTFDRISSASDVKARLDWGEPAFTIIDVRDRQSFNQERIQGAIFYAADQWIEQVSQTLEANRDIYVYGASEEDAIRAAFQLDESGFQKVAVMEGGLSAWKAIGGVTEGRKA